MRRGAGRPRTRSRGRRVFDAVLACLLVAALVCFGLYLGAGTHEKEALAQTAAELGPGEGGGSGERQIDWDALWAINPDVCAWVTVENTPIDLAVVQGTYPDPYRYLSRDLWGNWSRGGTPVLAPQCSPRGPHAQVFAHHVDDYDLGFSSIYRAWTPKVFGGLSKVAWYTPEAGREDFSVLFALRVDKDDQEAQRYEFPVETAREEPGETAQEGSETGPGKVTATGTDGDAEGASEGAPADGSAEGSEGWSKEALRAWLVSLGSRADVTADGWRERAEGAERVLSLVTCSSEWSGQRGRTVLVCVKD